MKLFLLYIFLIFGLWSQNQAYGQEKKVKLETQYIESNKDHRSGLEERAYYDLRPLWGTRISLSTAKVKPAEEHIEQNSYPIQVEIGFIKNFRAFSFGIEGFFFDGKWTQTIDIMGFGGGLVLHLDGFFSEPYFVPVLGGGVLDLKAEIGDAEVETEKQMIPYYKVGALITLNWIDRSLSRHSYLDYGLLNTYLYVGMRMITETHSDPNLNLGTQMSPEFGLQIEF